MRRLDSESFRSSGRGPALISLAVHIGIIGALVWMSWAKGSGPTSDPGFFGEAPRDSAGGLARRRVPPPLGPSIPRDLANEYLGRYRPASTQPPNTDLLVTVVNDGDIREVHWSLMVHDGERASYKLVPVAVDSFVQQFYRDRRIVFIRRDGAVTEIEISDRYGVRRAVRILPAEGN